MNKKKQPAPKKTKAKAKAKSIKPAFDIAKPLTEEERKRVVVAIGTQLKFLAERAYADPTAIAYMTSIPRLVVAFAHISNPKVKEVHPRDILLALTLWDGVKTTFPKLHYFSMAQLFISLFGIMPTPALMKILTKETKAIYKRPVPIEISQHPVQKGIGMLRDICMKAMGYKSKKRQSEELEKPVLFLTASLYALVNFPWQLAVSTIMMTFTERSVKGFLAIKSTKEMIDAVMNTQVTTIAITEAVAQGSLSADMPTLLHGMPASSVKPSGASPAGASEMKFQSDQSMF